MTEFIDALREAVHAENVKQNVLLKEHTTFKIGGPADYFVSPELNFIHRRAKVCSPPR